MDYVNKRCHREESGQNLYIFNEAILTLDTKMNVLGGKDCTLSLHQNIISAKKNAGYTSLPMGKALINIRANKVNDTTTLPKRARKRYYLMEESLVVC